MSRLSLSTIRKDLSQRELYFFAPFDAYFSGRASCPAFLHTGTNFAG